MNTRLNHLKLLKVNDFALQNSNFIQFNLKHGKCMEKDESRMKAQVVKKVSRKPTHSMYDHCRRCWQSFSDWLYYVLAM